MGLHLYGLEQDGEIIPPPTPVKELHPEAGAVVTMVEVLESLKTYLGKVSNFD